MLRKILPYLLLLVVICPTYSKLLRPGYFPMHDDMQAMRLLQMDKCVKDSQIPCRWVPDMGYGYGYPQFNYYAPLPYYLMELFHLSGFGFLDSVKVGFVVSLLVAAFGMYLLGSSLWGKIGGFLSAVVYAYAPYRAVDIYVRGAMGEAWGFSFLPIVLWSVKGVFEGRKNSGLCLALSLAALFTSHNITTLIFIPLLFAWIIFLVFFQEDSPTFTFLARYKQLFLSFVWGLSISAFFIFPSWFEKDLVHIETLLQGYFNYLAHFVSLGQLLFSTYWGFGTSEQGAYDDMSFAVGIIQWLLPLVSIALLVTLRKKKSLLIAGFFVVIGWFFLFLSHARSTFLWGKIGILEYLQFPWRFLIIVVFTFSAACGSLVKVVENKRSRIVVVFVMLILLLGLNARLFRPREWLEVTDRDKFSGELWEKQLTISIFDYLPKSAKFPPSRKAPEEPLVLEGGGEVISGQKASHWQLWRIRIDESNTKVRLSIIYFPKWRVTCNGEEVLVDIRNDLGIIEISLDKGEHEVFAQLVNTPIRSMANYLTFAGFVTIPVYLKKQRQK